MISKGVFIVGAKRTAFGTFGGKLKNFTATDLQEHACRGALASAKVDPKLIDSTIIGNCIQSSTDAAYVSRHVALRLGVPIASPALTINRLCGTGFQVIISAAHEIFCDGKHLVLVGGTESMSQAPYALRNARFGTKFGEDQKLEDTLWAGLTDQHIKTPMGITAENLADEFKLTRADCDNYALRSQKRWKTAQDAGRFNDEIVPLQIKGRKGIEEFKVDEHPRPDTTAQVLAKLPAVFKKNGTVNAGNASGVSDGAAGLVVASEEALKKHKLTPLARVVGWSYVGCDPSKMGIGPVPAIQSLLQKTGKTLADIDLVDVNEAFAPQFLSVEKALGLDPNKTNVNGGAIALGHPLAASGARISANLIYELRHRKAKLGVGSACIGGGQGIAVMFESCH